MTVEAPMEPPPPTRMHVGLNVDDLDEATGFYTKMFGRPPTLRRDGYVKWMLDDPHVNFSITASSDEPVGVNHLGLQVDDSGELERQRRAWDDADLDRHDQNDLVCGYQLQDKSWVFDPVGVPWEVFLTRGVVDEYGTDEMPDTR